MRKLFALFLIFIPLSDLCSQSNDAGIPVTMLAKLQQDSIAKNDAYYYRINKVKRVIEKEDDSRTITEIDRYGNETRSKWWLDGKLFNVTAYTYNEFGDWIMFCDTILADDGSVESVTISGRRYEILEGGNTERCILDTSEEREFEKGAVKNTFTTKEKYEYDSAGNCSRTVTNGYRTYCTDGPQKYVLIISSRYSESGKEVERDITEKGGCDNGYTSHNEYVYSESGLLVSHTSYRYGKVDGRGTYEYDEQGRQVKSTEYYSDGEIMYAFVYEYFDNGLTKRCDSYIFGDKDRDKYSYEYY